jgi:hypothetical protein
MMTSKLLVGVLMAAFALGASADVVSAASHGSGKSGAAAKGQSASKGTHKRTPEQCAAAFHTYNPATKTYIGKDGKPHECG